MAKKSSESKKVVIPKSVEYISEIFGELLSGEFENAKVGTIVYPTSLADAIKNSSEGKGKPHTTTIQNIFELWAIINEAQKKGWRVTEIKGGYYALQKVMEGEYDFDKVKEDFDKIKDKLDKFIEKSADGKVKSKS